MWKIGILTFHRAINYGAFLQAFALKTYLQKINHSAKIIDYWPVGHEIVYEVFSKDIFRQLPLLRKIKYIVRYFLIYKKANERKNKMEALMYKHFDIGSSPKYNTPQGLSDVQEDIVIYGSDQIWWKSKLKNYEGFDWAYWGDYIPKSSKKIAYAASMGVINNSEQDRIEISQRLCNFASIAVRETMLRDAICNLTDKPIDIVCDPVFLLDRDEWSQVVKPIKTPPKYVLLFNLMGAQDALRLAKRKALEMKIPLVEVTSKVLPLKYGKYCIQTADAFEFLYLVKNAEFVVTSSFHGTAFSVIFKKQFYSLGMNNNSGRVQSLLASINLHDRLITDIDKLDNTIINYTRVEDFLQNYINHSKSYIKESI